MILPEPELVFLVYAVKMTQVSELNTNKSLLLEN